MISNLSQSIHNEAKTIAAEYKKCEFNLIEILQKVDLHKVYYKFGYSSLFQYSCRELGLSEEVSYIFINVARKSKEIPALKAELKSGAITVSKAKRISPVINKENQSFWIAFAKTKSKREIEREVAKVSPKAAISEKVEFLPDSQIVAEKVKILAIPRIQLQLGVSEKLMIQLRRAQDI